MGSLWVTIAHTSRWCSESALARQAVVGELKAPIQRSKCPFHRVGKRPNRQFDSLHLPRRVGAQCHRAPQTHSVLRLTYCYHYCKPPQRTPPSQQTFPSSPTPTRCILQPSYAFRATHMCGRTAATFHATPSNKRLTCILTLHQGSSAPPGQGQHSGTAPTIHQRKAAYFPHPAYCSRSFPLYQNQWHPSKPWIPRAVVLRTPKVVYPRMLTEHSLRLRKHPVCTSRRRPTPAQRRSPSTIPRYLVSFGSGTEEESMPERTLAPVSAQPPSSPT